MKDSIDQKSLNDTIIKAMNNMSGEECELASKAFGLGEDIHGESGGCRAAFAAGMKYAAIKAGYPSQEKPWLRHYSDEIVYGSIPEVTIYDYLVRKNAHHLRDKAILFLGRTINYRELFVNIKKCAGALLACGCKKGDIVTISLPCIPEAVYMVFACNYLGLVANLIHPLPGASEVNRFLLEAKSEVFVMFDGTYGIVKEMLDRTYVKHAIVVSATQSAPFYIKALASLKCVELKQGYTDWNTFIEGGVKHPQECMEMKFDDLAIISHTGGTTGAPKGVMLSNRNMVSELWQIGMSMPKGDARDTLLMTILPPFINYSLSNSIVEPLVLGVPILLIPKYEPEKIGHYIRKYKPQHINSIPPYWEQLLNDPKAHSTDYSCLVNATYGGEAMDPGKRSAVNKLIKEGGGNVVLTCGYGMTELTSAAAANYPNCNSKGSSGIPLVKMDCGIFDLDDNSELSYKEEGEICFAGPTVMMGYFDNQEATDALIRVHEDGKRWLHTGDVGYIDYNGEIYITGRIKRIAITKGTDGVAAKLFPDRVEKAINKCGGIKECCVVEKPDADRVNVAVAFVCLKEGANFAGVKDAIMAQCGKDLPHYMLPKSVIQLNELPRTPRGKVDYMKLKQDYLG